MNRFIIFFALYLSFTWAAAQNGKIIDKKSIVLPDSVLTEVKKTNPAILQELATVSFSRITYISDGLKVTGYIAEPKKQGKYPSIIACRGGNRDFGQIDAFTLAFYYGRIASWGYLVIGTQYRGNDGGDGREEFGGKDVNDVLNLIPTLNQLPQADTSRIGLEGGSRGGMMAYLALKSTCKFKAAVIISGMANSFEVLKKRPEMEDVYGELVPNFQTNREEELKKRSAVLWADRICKSTPLLIIHGSSDWRVPANQAIEMAARLSEYRHPTRFILYEGADHFISEFRSERLAETKKHFDSYLRDGHKLPDMTLHGR